MLQRRFSRTITSAFLRPNKEAPPPRERSPRAARHSDTARELIPHERDPAHARAGDLASLPLLKRMGVTAAVRASCYVYTTAEEIDQLVATLANDHRGLS